MRLQGEGSAVLTRSVSNSSAFSPALLGDGCGKILKLDIGLAKHSLWLWFIFSTKKLHIPPCSKSASIC